MLAAEFGAWSRRICDIFSDISQLIDDLSRRLTSQNTRLELDMLPSNWQESR